MPKSANYLALERQWELLRILPDRAPGCTCRELVSRLEGIGYGVTKRTVERDLSQLESQFGIRCNDASKPYGWHWLPGQKESFGDVDLADAVSLSVAEGVLMQMLPPSMLRVLAPKFEQAREKLKSMSGHPIARLGEKVRYIPASLPFESPHISQPILETIEHSLVSEKQIEVQYAPLNQKPKNLKLHPLCLLQRGNVSYLLATTFDYSEKLLYAIHRFESVEVLDQKATIPEDFSIEGYLASGGMEFGSGKMITLRVRLSDTLATYLAETPLNREQKLQHKDGSYQLSARVHDSWQLQFWILSQGDGIQVLAPKSLRSRISKELSKASRQYA